MVNVSLGGQKNAAGDANAMFIRQFAGEVSVAFEEANLMLDLTRVRTISQGRAAQFPITGRSAAKYHQPGESLIDGQDAASADYLKQIQVTEALVNIDDLLVASCLIDNLDEMKSHWDYRGPFAQELGRALANELDRNIIRSMWQSAGGAAQAQNPAGMGSVNMGGANIAAVTSAELVAAFYDAAAKCDANDLPVAGRFAVVQPDVYYRLIQDSTGIGAAVNRDYDAAGSVSKGQVVEFAGFKIHNSQHIKDCQEDYTDPAGAKNTYTGDMSLTGGIFGHEEAVATAKLQDIKVESDYLVERQATLFAATLACGSAPLRHDAAGYFKFA